MTFSCHSDGDNVEDDNDVGNDNNGDDNDDGDNCVQDVL